MFLQDDIYLENTITRKLYAVNKIGGDVHGVKVEVAFIL